jgi:hypothetical protein
MLALVGADYKFLIIDVGSAGRNSDSGLYESSEVIFYENLLKINDLNKDAEIFGRRRWPNSQSKRVPRPPGCWPSSLRDFGRWWICTQAIHDAPIHRGQLQYPSQEDIQHTAFIVI